VAIGVLKLERRIVPPAAGDPVVVLAELDPFDTAPSLSEIWR
jgi:hypothetical protein